MDAEAVKKMLRDIAESAGDAVICCNTSGNIRYVNRQAREVFGYSGDELIGESVTRLMPTESVTDYEAGFAQWSNEKRPTIRTRKTLAGVRKDGQALVIQLTLNDMRLGGSDYVVGIVRDVSEQEATRKTLRLLQVAFEAAAHSTVIADAEGRIVWLNPAFTRMTGYTAEDATGAKTSLLKSGAMDVEYYENLWGTITSGKTWRGTLLNRRKNGSVYLEKQAITPVLNEAGMVEHFIAVKEDVTDAVETQQTLRKTHDRYQRLFESSPSALYEEDYSAVKAFIDKIKRSGVTDLREYFSAHPAEARSCASMINIIDVNEAAVRMSGAKDKDDLLGNLTSLFNEASYENLVDQLVWIAAGNLSYAAEVENRTLGGDTLCVELKLNIAPEFSESWSEVIISLTDISERKQREKQFAHSMKMEAVGRLTGGIAHDFNNVLTVISGNLRLISDTSGDEMGEEMKEMIGDVLSAADDGAQLTSRLLAFSRQPTSRVDQISVNDVILDFVELLNHTLGSGIDVVTRFKDGPIRMETDKSAFANALWNLSINARDAMTDGGTLTFTVSNGVFNDEKDMDGYDAVEPASCVVVEVIDTGCGMAADVIENTTVPFFTTKPIDEGNGLGLSMVQEFANEYGGKLKIGSKIGVGTTIGLYLPLQLTRQ